MLCLSLIEIKGGHKLNGEVMIQGSKNTVLPILAASLLCKDVTILHNCPHITDVDDMLLILEDMGCHTKWYGHSLVIDTRSIIDHDISLELAKRLRSSVLFMGALIGRCKEVSIGYPGGCNIGARPIDLHLKAFKSMNVTVDLLEETIVCYTDFLTGAKINLPFPSVGATENILLASVLAAGTTSINNAAKEPEIIDLVTQLRNMGANIKGEGTGTITIEGVKRLYGSNYFIPYDRIVAATYLFTAIGTNSIISLLGIDEIDKIKNILEVAEQMGARFEYKSNTLVVDGTGATSGINVITSPYPGVPTDIQALTLVVLSTANGKSQIVEGVFEARFQVIHQLSKMGALLNMEKSIATIIGTTKLIGCQVEATDLRGGAALIIAGLMADGVTQVDNIMYIERGYEDIVRDLRGLGASIIYKETSVMKNISQSRLHVH